jgi:hypothetical protein
LTSVDSPGLPLGLVVLVVIVMPICVAVFFGLFAFKTMTPLAYRCQRCGHEFRRKPYRRFPAECPHCHARDWNVRA